MNFLILECEILSTTERDVNVSKMNPDGELTNKYLESKFPDSNKKNSPNSVKVTINFNFINMTWWHFQFKKILFSSFRIEKKGASCQNV